MNSKNLNLLYFSPTGTTQKIVRTIGQFIGWNNVNDYNITKSIAGDHLPQINENSITVIGLPVYAGRLPGDIAKRLEKLQGNNSIAVLVVVYGNRAFEDSLLELKDIVTNSGFRIIAAAAFIGEHSYSTASRPIAEGRPDGNDLLKCAEFSQKIQEKLQQIETTSDFSDIIVSGNFPYKEQVVFPAFAPEIDSAVCNSCGICESVCPTNAIAINTEVVTNKDLCIRCCACIKSCPTDARFFNNPIIDNISEKLTVLERKEPAFFL
ncbi:MAG: EFR1 family ferrodoxin [Marinifilaceae bacterium]